MIKPRQTHVIKFVNYDILDENLKRHTFPDTKEVYVTYFEEETEEVKFGVWNMHGDTGEEYITDFIVPISNVKSVRDLETDEYITSKLHS